MKILLICPQSDDDVVNSIVRQIPFMRWRKPGAQIAPLALATVAALTPSEHEVSIHDEHAHGPIEPLLEENDYDIIGISMLVNQLNRTFSIAEFCKKKKLRGRVVVGGAGTAGVPPELSHLIDIVFFGEAEETWPQFLEEFKEGRHRPHYQQISKPDMSKSPIPRWDLIRDDLPASAGVYAAGAVQTTRGCPYDCSFCDVIYIYGRKLRTKPIEQVLEEIRILEAMGVRDILISDDNFAVTRRRAKELLREIMKLNNAFKVPIRFATQGDITIAGDEELLELMADSNLIDIIVGIESINKDSLKDLNKPQNLRMDLHEAVQKIQSYGIAVMASMIIGADSDDRSTFKRTGDFVKEANITDHFCHPLLAPCGTKIWYQFRREGRLVKLSHEWRDRGEILTNIIPKQMTRIELMEGLADYWEIVFDPLHYMERAIGFIRGVKRRPRVKQAKLRSIWNHRKMLVRMFWYYFIQATPDHRKAFFKILWTTLFSASYLLPQMIFLHIRFMINHKRIGIAARLARERAAWERSHPDELTIADRFLPIPQSVRENAGEIFAAAYARVRKKVSDPETLYRLVIEAMIDYIDRFGQSFERFDEHHLGYVNESCDRIMANASLPKISDSSELPPGSPPPGFDREILDGLDHAIRIRESVAA